MQTPSAQNPLWQSLPARHFLPFPQRVVHLVALPPQSVSVSLPSLTPSSQPRLPKQPSGKGPRRRVLPKAAHVPGVQPQTTGVPPPPHVFGTVQSALDWQPHWPWALQSFGIETVPPHMTPGLFVCTTVPPASQESVTHVVPDDGVSVSSTTVLWLPEPSQTILWQSPGICGVPVVLVPAAV